MANVAWKLFLFCKSVLVLLDIGVYRGSCTLYFIYVAVPGRNHPLRISTTLPRSKRCSVCMHVHVCISLVSRLFLIERGNESGDEAMFAPAAGSSCYKEGESLVHFIIWHPPHSILPTQKEDALVQSCNQLCMWTAATKWQSIPSLGLPITWCFPQTHFDSHESSHIFSGISNLLSHNYAACPVTFINYKLALFSTL